MSIRDRSKEEVRKKLEKKGFSSDVIAKTLSDLESRHYIQDERFALQWGAAQIRQKFYGPQRLRTAFLEKGLSRELVEEALADLYQQFPEMTVAEEAIRKKRGSSSAALSIREKRRLVDYLRRRGFEYDTISKLIRNLEE